MFFQWRIFLSVQIRGFRFPTFTCVIKTQKQGSNSACSTTFAGRGTGKHCRESFALVLPPVSLEEAEQVEAALAKA